MSEALRVCHVTGDCERLCALFDQLFAHNCNTRLLGGVDEPLYLPAGNDCPFHRVYFREDYIASALHEVAHWCIAGAARRQRPDYGYWYRPDGRSAEEQRKFESVEARPQALEWIFSRAAGVSFRVSIDNLHGAASDPFPFQLAVWRAANHFVRGGLNDRAERFRRALAAQFGGSARLCAEDFTLRVLGVDARRCEHIDSGAPLWASAEESA